MSYPVHVRIDPTFGHDITRIRGRNSATTTDLDWTRLFSVHIPLTLSSDPLTIDADGTPHVTFSANPTTARVIPAATTPTQTTRNLLHESGDAETRVDSISRTVVQQPAAAAALIEHLSDHPEVSPETLSLIKEALMFSNSSGNETSDTHQHADTVATMVTHHENQHLSDLIDPNTAFWKELELFWQLQQILAAPTAVESPGIVNRFAVLYSLPRQIVAELNAIAAERAALDPDNRDSTINAQLTADRGLEQQVWDYFRTRGVAPETITDLVSHPIAQQFGDIWIVYALSQLQAGHSVAELSGDAFLDQIGVERPDELLGVSAPPELGIDEVRDTFTELVFAQLYGPAFEVISLESSSEDAFSLTRTWYNTNPTTSETAHQLALRRALFVRYFLSEFRTRTQLLTVRDRITDAVAAGIAGTPISLSAPVIDIDTSRVAETIHTSCQAAISTLEGIDSRDDLAQWLNQPAYDPRSQS